VEGCDTVTTVASSEPEPQARRTLFAVSRRALVDLWGDDGLAQVAALLPEDVRRDTIDSIVVASEWLPESYMIAWYQAIWQGPGQRRTEGLRRFIDRRMDLGFGRVRKLMLNVISPEQLLAKAPELWRHDHTTGTLAGTFGAPNDVSLTLREHPYTVAPLARLATAEVYRYALSLVRGTHDVTERHGVEEEGTLVVRLAWKQ
jgi:hypothetical protein